MERTTLFSQESHNCNLSSLLKERNVNLKDISGYTFLEYTFSHLLLVLIVAVITDINTDQKQYLECTLLIKQTAEQSIY